MYKVVAMTIAGIVIVIINNEMKPSTLVTTLPRLSLGSSSSKLMAWRRRRYAATTVRRKSKNLSGPIENGV
jgi:hypothetical protein